MDIKAARGEAFDRVGDGFDNAGEHNTCHNAAMRAVTAVISADAVGQIRHGDKKDPARTADMITTATLSMWRSWAATPRRTAM